MQDEERLDVKANVDAIIEKLKKESARVEARFAQKMNCFTWYRMAYLDDKIEWWERFRLSLDGIELDDLGL